MSDSNTMVDAPTIDNSNEHVHTYVNKVMREKYGNEYRNQLNEDGTKRYGPSFMDKTTDLDYSFPAVIPGTIVTAIANEKRSNNEPFVIPDEVPTNYVLAFEPVEWNAIVDETTGVETQPKLLVATYKPLMEIQPSKVRL